MRRLVPVVLFLALSSACASARPSATGTPPQGTGQGKQPQPVEPYAPARVASPSSLDPIEEHPEAEAQREQQQDDVLREAQRLFQQFIARAGDDPYYAEAVQRSRERIADIDEILRFRAQGRLERARAEQAQ